MVHLILYFGFNTDTHDLEARRFYCEVKLRDFSELGYIPAIFEKGLSNDTSYLEIDPITSEKIISTKKQYRNDVIQTVRIPVNDQRILDFKVQLNTPVVILKTVEYTVNLTITSLKTSYSGIAIYTYDSVTGTLSFALPKKDFEASGIDILKMPDEANNIVNYNIGQRLKIDFEYPKAIESSSSASTLISDFFGWIQQLPLHLVQILPYALTTLSITCCSMLLILCLAIYLSILSYIDEMKQKFTGEEKKKRFADLLCYMFIPSFLLAYLCIPLVHQDVYFIKYILAIILLVFGDGLLSGFYQQFAKIIKDETGLKYITALHAKGLAIKSKGHAVLWDIVWPVSHPPTILRHTFRNVFGSFLPILGNRTPYLFGGAIVIEQIFNIDGLSVYMVKGISSYAHIDMILTLTVFCAVSIRCLNALLYQAAISIRVT